VQFKYMTSQYVGNSVPGGVPGYSHIRKLTGGTSTPGCIVGRSQVPSVMEVGGESGRGEEWVVPAHSYIRSIEYLCILYTSSGGFGLLGF
jgi:hypothetical protein